MLKIKPNCEHCGKNLPNTSNEAMICTYECTFCEKCVTTIFYNVCPNCGGGFVKRPTRPKAGLEKYPSDQTKFHRPVDLEKFKPLLLKYINIDPRKR